MFVLIIFYFILIKIQHGISLSLVGNERFEIKVLYKVPVIYKPLQHKVYPIMNSQNLNFQSFQNIIIWKKHCLMFLNREDSQAQKINLTHLCTSVTSFTKIG